MRSALILTLVACGSSKSSSLPAAERDKALVAAKQCTEAVDALAPSYQMVGPKLSEALKMDRAAAQRLMRDSVELLISTRELLCNVSMATVDNVLAQGKDDQVLAAQARVKTAVAHLQTVRKAYDELLGAASSAQAPVDEAALLERMTSALSGK